MFANTKKKNVRFPCVSMRSTNARKAKKQQTEEFDGEAKKGKKKASTPTKTGLLDQQEPHPMLLMNLSSLKEYFTTHILHQDVAMEQIANLLVECTYADRLDTTEPILIKALLSGASGTGKTTTCELLQTLLCMKKGQKYEKQFIKELLAGYSDPAQITGAIPGCIGHGDSCFATKYYDACENVDGEPPPFIFIMLDEIDKAEAVIVNSFNSLLDRGQIKAASKENIATLNSKTILIVLLTANYGEDLIDPLALDEGVEKIKQDMKEKGLQSCDIGRIENIIVFPQFTKEQMSDIFFSCRDKVVNQHRFSCQYGTPSIDKDNHQLFIDNILRCYDHNEGFRGAIKAYKSEMHALLNMAFHFFQENLPKDQACPLAPLAECKFTTIPVINDQELFLSNNPLISDAIERSSCNKSRFNVYVKQQLPVSFLSITFQLLKVVNLVAPKNVNTINNKPISQNHTESIEERDDKIVKRVIEKIGSRNVGTDSVDDSSDGSFDIIASTSEVSTSTDSSGSESETTDYEDYEAFEREIALHIEKDFIDINAMPADTAYGISQMMAPHEALRYSKEFIGQCNLILT